MLAAGSHLGVYEVAGLLGVGGMGEVYRARDPKLGRDVALKVLPPEVAADADRIARFHREAHLLASLNHQNIAGIYGFEDTGGIAALVLELVEGPTLADAIARGPLDIEDALAAARQIADALEFAHDKGVIHRDLKPANIKITPDGHVKVLDFGLAKALEPDPSMAAADLRNSPTVSVHATRAGVILGTATYMSPEQARGRPVDRRGDIWAFGCVLYEMLAGTRTFPGDDVTETIAAIVRGEPDWTRLPAATPPAIRVLLRRCLEKDPKDRLPSIGVARLEIKDALTPPGGESRAPASVVVPVSSRRLVPWIAAAAAVAVTGTAMWVMRPAPIERPVLRSSLLPPANVSMPMPPANRLALAPDGRRLAMLATSPDGVTRIWMRSLDAMAAQQLSGTEGALTMFWSYDSRRLAFVSAGKLRILNVLGGPPVAIADSESNNGGSWNQDDVILFLQSPTSAIFRINAAGGTPVAVTTRDETDDDRNHWQPFFLPDGRHFLFHLSASKSQPGGAVYAATIDGSTTRQLVMSGGSNAQYADGQLLFLRDGMLLAQPFDPDRLALSGEPAPIAENVQTGGSTGRTGAFSVSRTGALVYQAGAVTVNSRLAWYDRAGKGLGTLGDPADYGDLQLSPDGNRVAVGVLDPAARARDIWIVDVRRGSRTRFTHDPAGEDTPVWSPDGARVLFNLRTGGTLELFTKAADGSGIAERVYGGRSLNFPTGWSRDGKHIAFASSRSGSTDLYALTLGGVDPPTPLAQTKGVDTSGAFSPNGSWIAYASNEAGRFEIYVVAASGTGGRWPVSTSGGVLPRWRRDGKEIYYVAPDNKLMAVTVSDDGVRFEPGAVRPLFEIRPKGNTLSFYDVTADGQRFLVNTAIAEPAPEPATLMLNWTTGLKK